MNPANEPTSKKLTVAIAGAGGYIGSWFIEKYKDR